MAFQPPTKSQNQSAAVILIILSLLLICFAIYTNPENIDHIRANGELIKKGDPRFNHEVTVCRLLMGFVGLLFLVGSSLYLWRTRKTPTDE